MAVRYAATITEADLRTYLEVLASDAYEGRETGMKGQKMAAAYIEQKFMDFGIPPVPDATSRGMINGYQQQYVVVQHTPGSSSISIGGTAFAFMKDQFYFNESVHHDIDVNEITVVTTATMTSIKEAENRKVVLVIDQEPDGTEPTDKSGRRLFGLMRSVNSALAGSGTELVLIISDAVQDMMQDHGRRISAPHMELADPAGTTTPEDETRQVIFVGSKMADAIFKQTGSSRRKLVKKASRSALVEPVSVSFKYSPSAVELTAENVLGYVEGTDKRDELLLVTAHYDHIGMDGGEVYNGADDDGSGTVAVLEMAQAFAQAKAEGHGPRRSVLFMTVSGEEKGLLGSEYYTEHPIFPLNLTVTDLNIDMIGRTDPVHADGPPYVYVIGSAKLSSELHEISSAVNDTYTGLVLDYTFDADNDPNRFYYRSDHYNFAKHGVPIIFYFNGVHEDYHGPKDEVDRIRFDLLHQRTLLVYYTAWTLATREHRVVVDAPAGTDVK